MGNRWKPPGPGQSRSRQTFGMVWYGMVYVDLYSAIVANVSNALGSGRFVKQ